MTNKRKKITKPKEIETSDLGISDIKALTTLPPSLKQLDKTKVAESKSKRVPMKKDPETGETTFNWSYMLKTDAEKKFSKLRSIKTKSLNKSLLLLYLQCIIGAQTFFWLVEYYCGELLRKIRFLYRYLTEWYPQKLRRGFDDRELWDLSMNLISFISTYLHPRIKAYREATRLGYPTDFKSQEDWEKVLGAIDEGFKIIVEEGTIHFADENDARQKKATEAVLLFSQHWTKLWD